MAVLCGFEPDEAPGVGTCYNFMDRLVDGPYRKRKENEVKRSEFNARKHARNFKSEKEPKRHETAPCHSKSELLRSLGFGKPHCHWFSSAVFLGCNGRDAHGSRLSDKKKSARAAGDGAPGAAGSTCGFAIPRSFLSFPPPNSGIRRTFFPSQFDLYYQGQSPPGDRSSKKNSPGLWTIRTPSL